MGDLAGRNTTVSDKMDDLRKRVEHFEPISDSAAVVERLVNDLWAWGQEQAAEAKAWKHANAMVPVTAEELGPYGDLIIEANGQLYRQYDVDMADWPRRRRGRR
jgi:hypothetical protein